MADSGDIQNNIALGALQAVRRNAGDTDFEAFTAGTITSLTAGTGITLTPDPITTTGVISLTSIGAVNIYNETQTADGTSTLYYLTNYAAPGTIRVYVDGIRQPASDDTAATDEVNFTSAPDAGALLMFDYEMDQA